MKNRILSKLIRHEIHTESEDIYWIKCYKCSDTTSHKYLGITQHELITGKANIHCDKCGGVLLERANIKNHSKGDHR